MTIKVVTINSSKEKKPTEEIILYREAALRAAALGKEKLARFWRLAADEAQFVRQQQRTTSLLPFEKVSFTPTCSSYL